MQKPISRQEFYETLVALGVFPALESGMPVPVGQDAG
jgi:hypothetical protein